MLQLRDFSFRYAGSKGFLWDRMSYDFLPGEIVLVKGKNGTGKTTFLYALCGVIPDYIKGEVAGEVLLNGKPVAGVPLKEKAQEINMLFQEPDKQLFMPVVEEEIAFGPENLCLPREDIAKRVDDVLRMFEIGHLRYRKTADLSFGQKKLVLLAGIAAMSPQVMLIDEFCAGMEDRMIGLFAEYLTEMRRDKKTVILAEHHTVMEQLADRIIDLNQ